MPAFEVTASPGLLDLELGNNNGAINYRPRGLAQVLDAAERERAVSTPSPKPGTQVVADDAISNNPFAASA